MFLSATIAVFDHDADNVELLRIILEQEGFGVVTALVSEVLEGAIDMERLITEHEAAVIVWAIAPPCRAQYQLLSELRRRPECGRRPFVITTTCLDQLRDIARQDTSAQSILQKPFDIQGFVESVRRAEEFHRLR
jgi:CheY-like chemotaxis protein